MTDTRERILQAAVQALAIHGYAGTTARSIAAIGGFAPGVIYYHYDDLDAVLVATAQYTSAARETRYRSAVTGVTSAVSLVRQLRLLYAEDAGSGHVAAVKELIAAARPASPLATAIIAVTRSWEDLTEQVVREQLHGKPMARYINVPVMARAVVAYYLGMQTLTHLDQDASRPDAAFAQAERLAALFDKLPRRRSARPARQ